MRNRFKTLKFDRKPIRSIETENGSVLWLCLNDIAKVLDRSDLVSNGTAMKLCRSSFRIPFKVDGRNRWGVKPHDVCFLLNVVRDENSRVELLCSHLEEWVNSLPVEMKNPMPITIAIPIPISHEPVIFNYQDQFPISFKAENGKTKINATQMGLSFQKKPATWLKLATTVEFRETLVSQGVSESFESQVVATRGMLGVTWIDEELAIEYARWLSPEFSIWCNQRIHELMRGGSASSERLKRGFNSKPAQSIPQTFDEALLLAADQARKIREDEHKVVFYDEYIENRNWFKSSRIADELEITVTQLNRFLHEEEIIRYDSRAWVASAPYRALQTDIPYLYHHKNGTVYTVGANKRWNQAGRDFILDLWYERNPELQILQIR